MKKVLALLLCLLFTLSFAACGSDSGEAEKDATADAATDAAAEGASPYNWLGYPDIPQCNYLDCLATGHFYSEYTGYILVAGSAVSADYIIAADGGNYYEYSATNSTKSYSLEGMIYTISESSKIYRVMDYTEAYAGAPSVEEQIKANKNETGKVFQGGGTAAIPIYETIDATEYEYYEYVTGEGDTMVTERLFMKDGDVYAIYSKVGQEDSESETVNIITKMTDQIPEGIFELPDLSGYELQS